MLLHFATLFSLLTSASALLEPVNLRTAGNYAILSKSGVTTTDATSVTGDVGTSPIAVSGVTGFGLTQDSSSKLSTSVCVTGKVYGADQYPASLTTAISDMESAFTDAAGRAIPDFTELGGGNIEDLTFVSGLYK